MDVNDNPPRFANASLEASLSELTPVGHRVLRLHADSADSGANAEIRYRLLDNDGLFSVDAVSGELTLKSPLDYEQRREYHLTIRAFDTSSRPLSATAVVTVRVLDENDNAPQFPPGGFNVTARENADPGTRLPVDIAATDADSGDNGRLAYQIRAGDPDGMFSLDSASGRFYARRRLDRETQELYSLTVTAADHGRPPFTATTTVRVTVLDQNDCSPQFDRPDYSFIAQVDDSGNITQQPYLEDTDPEDPTASLIRVTDCDAPPNGGPFVWSVVEGNSMKFAVSSGRLRISEAFPQPLGVELIRIQACDGGDLRGSAQASIRTVRTQSAPPRVLPQNLTAVFAEPPAPGLRLGGVTLAGGRQLEDSNVRLRLASHADRFELGRAGDLLVSNGNLAASRTDYRLRVRAETLNGLRSAQELRLRLVMATEDMTRNAVCLRVSNESGFSFVFSGLESVTREAISQQLRIDSDDAFVLGLQSASDVKGDVPGSSDDLLVVVAAYDRRDRRYLTAR
uniref:Cadherin domain-containing protein n=1 Tax=Macrostomum lignano TaxID=282301 RepID=A0A1I8J7E7_9PLAT